MSKKNTIIGSLIVVMLIATIVLVINSKSKSEEVAEKIIDIEFTAYPAVKKPTEDVNPDLGVVHICTINDTLLLEKIEIYGEYEIPVRTFTVNKYLNAIGNEYNRHKFLVEKMDLIKKGEIEFTDEEVTKIQTELSYLYQTIQTESFTTGRFSLTLDKLKTNIMPGDIVPIMAKIYLVHNDTPVTISKTLNIELLTGGL